MRTNLGNNRFVGQLGNGAQDHAFWRRPDEIREQYPAYMLHPGAPGSDVIGSMAAALASFSSVMQGVDAGYSNTLLEQAKQFYSFAKNHNGFYHESISDATAFYRCGLGWLLMG